MHRLWIIPAELFWRIHRIFDALDIKSAAAFYVEHLGFEITDESPDMISIRGNNINMFIERGPALGPVFEVTVDNVAEARERLVKAGCVVVKDACQGRRHRQRPSERRRQQCEPNRFTHY